MAPVAWHVDNFVIAGNVVQAIDVTQFDAIIDPVPHPTQKSLSDSDRGVGNVGRNLLRVFARFLCGPLQFGAAIARLGIDGSTHSWIVHHNVKQCPPM